MLQTNLYTRQSRQEKEFVESIERLSSGKRVNRSSDDAAGLQVATRMNATSKGLSMVTRELGHMRTLLQTADDTLSSISDHLQRVRELTVQSKNGTLSSSDRGVIQREIDSLLANIDRTASTMPFSTNGSIRIGSSLTPNYIDLGLASFITNQPTQPRTYDVELQVEGFRRDSSFIMARLVDTQFGYLSVNMNNRHINIRDDVANVDTGVVLPMNEKVRLTFTYENGAGTLYVNGEKKATVPLQTITSFRKMTLGDKPTGPREGIIGDFYGFHYYEKALSEQEVLHNHQGNLTPDASGSYDFTRGSGLVVRDLSGNGNHGTLRGDVSRSEQGVPVHTGPGAKESRVISTPAASLNDLYLNSFDIDSPTSIQQIDTALSKLSIQRSSVGSELNRLEMTIEQASTTNRETLSAMSRIEGADVALEMSKLTKNQLLEQTQVTLWQKTRDYYQNSLQLLQQ